MSLALGEIAPDFSAETTEGPIEFHAWADGHWVVLFSHPKDFTPVCTTELGALAALAAEFARRDVKVIGLSLDSVADHRRWALEIAASQGHSLTFPLIADHDLKIAKLYGMLPASAGDSAAGRSAADNQTVRSLFIIDPEKRVRMMTTYPMSTGRNFAELLRVLDSLQLTQRHQVATPADWCRGEPVIILPALSDAAARERFPGGWHAVTPYLRLVPDPSR